MVQLVLSLSEVFLLTNVPPVLLDRDALPVDSNRSQVGVPPARALSLRIVAVVVLCDKRLDLLTQNCPAQEADHLGVVLKKLGFHVNRLIQQVLNGFGYGRLFGVAAGLNHFEKVFSG